MMIVGFHASHEQLPPAPLLHAVKRAEEAGFVALHDFAPRPTVVSLELGPVAERSVLSDLLHADRYDLDGAGRIDMQLDAYGYRWFRIVEPDDRRLT